MTERTCVDRCGDKTYLPFIFASSTVILFFYSNRQPSIIWGFVPMIFIFVWFMTWYIRRLYKNLVEGPSCPCRFF